MSNHQTNGKSARESQWKLISEFWNKLRIEDLGGNHWETLENLERIVTECQYSDPPDLKRARAATAEAIYWLNSEE